MDRLVNTALTAMRGAMARQASIANNLANANTVGFRAEIANAETRWIQGDSYAYLGTADVEGSYEGVLPALNTVLELTPDVLVRFSATQNLNRPGLGSMAAKGKAFQDADSGEITASRGNPNLKPYKDLTLDFAVEYYFGQSGLLSAALFHKDIENFIGSDLLENIPFNLRDLIQDTLTILAPAAHEKRLELVSLVYRDTPLQLVGDPLRLKQVLTNLISNAIKFTSEGGVGLRVERAARREHEHARRREPDRRERGRLRRAGGGAPGLLTEGRRAAPHSSPFLVAFWSPRHAVFDLSTSISFPPPLAHFACPSCPPPRDIVGAALCRRSGSQVWAWGKMKGGSTRGLGSPVLCCLRWPAGMWGHLFVSKSGRRWAARRGAAPMCARCSSSPALRRWTSQVGKMHYAYSSPTLFSLLPAQLK